MINRPKSQSTPPDQSNPTVVVQISDSGHVKLNGKRVDIERLSARIENFLAENQTSAAVVLADKEATHEMVVKVIDQIKAFDQLSISIGGKAD